MSNAYKLRNLSNHGEAINKDKIPGIKHLKNDRLESKSLSKIFF